MNRTNTTYNNFSYTGNTCAGTYLYGFNGQEKTDEVYGDGNEYTAENWEYDPRLGRRWNIDPIIKVFESVYACFYNNPIRFADNAGSDPIGQQYKIKKGDTFESIAKNSGGKYTVQDLVKWNSGLNPKTLKVGSLINISDPSKGMKLGSTGKVGTGEDATYGGGSSGKPKEEPTTTEGKNQLESFGTDKNKAIAEYVLANSNATIASACPSDVGDDVDKTVARFLSGAGGVFADYHKAEQVFSGSEQFQTLQNNIKAKFEASYNTNKGDLTMVTLAGEIKAPNLGPICNSMYALFGGTQQLDVVLMDLSVKSDNTYTATFSGVIYDDYGVSTTDFTKSRGFFAGTVGGAQKGLTGMWILQHQYGFKPLINTLNFNFTISGTFKP